MITYQVKITIDPTVELEWLKWMKTVHVPDVIATGMIKSYQILKPDGSDQLYMFHYHFESYKDYEQYRVTYAPKLKAHPHKKYPDLFRVERGTFQWV